LTAEELSMLSSYLAMSVSLYIHLFISPVVGPTGSLAQSSFVQPRVPDVSFAHPFFSGFFPVDTVLSPSLLRAVLRSMRSELSAEQ
jgi:hypothetical protein